MNNDAARQADWVMPMHVDASGNPAGIAVAVTTSVVAVDLTTMPGLPGTWPTNVTTANPNPLGHILDIEAEGGDVYAVCGPTFASVTGANAPVPGTTNTVNGGTGAVTLAKGICMHIPAGTTRPFRLPEGNIGSGGGPFGSGSPCRFVALITKSGTATARLWQSST